MLILNLTPAQESALRSALDQFVMNGQDHLDSSDNPDRDLQAEVQAAEEIQDILIGRLAALAEG